LSRLPGCSLKTDEGLKLGRGENDYRTEAGTKIMALKWCDNKPVLLFIFRSQIAHAVPGARKTTAKNSGRLASNSPTLEL